MELYEIDGNLKFRVIYLNTWKDFETLEKAIKFLETRLKYDCAYVNIRKINLKCRSVQQ